MVRHINSVVYCESDPTEYTAPYWSVRDSRPAPSLRDDLVETFLRFGRAHPRLGFERLVAKWVARRIKLNLKVDFIDPEDKEPSKLFMQILRASFDAAKRDS